MLALVVSTLIASAAPPPATVIAWTQFRAGATHNVVLPGDLHTAWTAVTGGAISSSPIVSGDTLYVGNNKGYLSAIDVRTGAIQWRRHLSNDVMSQPLLYDNTLIVGEGDANSFGSAPAPVYVGMGPSAIVALDPRNGALKWRTTVAGSAMPTGAIVNGVLIEHNGAGWITALDPSNGKVRYARNLHSIASMTAALPVAGNDIVTVGVLSNAVFKLRAGDGSIVWRTGFPASGSGHGDCPIASDGKLLVCTYVMPVPPAIYTLPGNAAIEHAYALDIGTGAKVWDVALGRGTLPPRNEAAIPLLVHGVAYLGSAISPFMHAIDVKTGRVIWERKVHGPVKGGAVEVHGRIYFGDLRGYLWSLDAKTGAVVGSKKMNSGFNVGSPIVVGQTLIIGSRTGSVYAIPLENIDAAHDV